MTPDTLRLLQLAAFAAVALLVTGLAFFRLKPEHAGGRLTEARIGAAVFGLMFGAVVALVILPLRLSATSGAETPTWLPFLIVLVFFLRSDRSARLPVLGRYLTAYRAAGLRRGIADSEKRLAKLEGLAKPDETAPAEDAAPTKSE